MSLAWLPLPEQPQDDTDGDQADEAIVAHRLNHGDEIADNVARYEADRPAEQDLEYNAESNQQQAKLNDLAEPTP